MDLEIWRCKKLMFECIRHKVEARAAEQYHKFWYFIKANFYTFLAVLHHLVKTLSEYSSLAEAAEPIKFFIFV